ncbi:MAG TPA: hypothetical protein DCM08_10270 [Microscillaceae bacterium]|jgi:hypothetical protein|nr:hypothetical protein [Microscillaceae bacterium]
MVVKEFPHTEKEPFEITSPETDQYNCLAWAMHDSQRWWDTADDDFWIEANRDNLLQTVIEVCQKLGFQVCEDEQLEEGYEKIALFSNDKQYCAHVARQLNNGKWTSKLGQSFDVIHSIFAIENGIYGNAAIFLKKPKPLS